MQLCINNSALSRWFADQPNGEYTCTECGRIGPKSLVQPQHPRNGGGAICGDCHNRHVDEYRAKRTAELAAMPRCEFCNRRGTVKVGLPTWPTDTRALLCGRHYKAARAAINSRIGGMFWLASEITGNDIRAALSEKE